MKKPTVDTPYKNSWADLMKRQALQSPLRHRQPNFSYEMMAMMPALLKKWEEHEKGIESSGRKHQGN